MMADLLVRFFEHDNDLEEDIEWSVAGGALEDNKRYYRIMYNNNIDKKEEELVITVTDSRKILQPLLLKFKETVYSWFDAYTSKAFRKEVDTIFTIDPWLSTINS